MSDFEIAQAVMNGIGNAHHDIDHEDVQYLLDALRANGYEVVKLPDQMTDKSSAYYAVRDRPMWLVNDSWTCIDVEGDIEFEAFGQDSIGSGLSPRDARALAAALLAAAAAADRAGDEGEVA